MAQIGESAIGRQIQLACLWEATARKVGNVHRYADFTGLTYLDFVLSAAELRVHLAEASRCWVGDAPVRTPLGLSIKNAIRATQHVVRTNTNLGMALLLAPLAAAMIDSADSAARHGHLRQVLSDLSVGDARNVFEAVRIARPGGLGAVAEQDVREEPTGTLLEAMRLATDRDMVARQYANAFADVFDFGVPAFLDALAEFKCVEAAIIGSQLRWLATYPDSLIARKNGPEIAADVQRRAADVLQLGGIATAEGRAAGVELDKHLRSDGNKLNPGTTADLIAACLFVALRENKVSPSAPFRWDVRDWL